MRAVRPGIQALYTAQNRLREKDLFVGHMGFPSRLFVRFADETD